MKYTPDEIDYAFAGTNDTSGENRTHIAKALSLLDKKVVDKIIEEIHFFDGWRSYAFHLPLNTKMLEGKKAFIFLSENLKEKTEEEIIKIILHEVAHHYLNHKCLFDFSIYDEKEKKKYSYQEVDADDQVRKWLK